MTVLKGTGCTLCAKSELHEGVDKGRRWAYCPLGGTVKKNTHTRKDLGPAARLVKEPKKAKTVKDQVIPDEARTTMELGKLEKDLKEELEGGEIDE